MPMVTDNDILIMRNAHNDVTNNRTVSLKIKVVLSEDIDSFTQEVKPLQTYANIYVNGIFKELPKTSKWRSIEDGKANDSNQQFLAIIDWKEMYISSFGVKSELNDGSGPNYAISSNVGFNDHIDSNNLTTSQTNMFYVDSGGTVKYYNGDPIPIDTDIVTSGLGDVATAADIVSFVVLHHKIIGNALDTVTGWIFGESSGPDDIRNDKYKFYYHIVNTTHSYEPLAMLKINDWLLMLEVLKDDPHFLDNYIWLDGGNSDKLTNFLMKLVLNWQDLYGNDYNHPIDQSHLTSSFSMPDNLNDLNIKYVEVLKKTFDDDKVLATSYGKYKVLGKSLQGIARSSKVLLNLVNYVGEEV